MLIKVNKITKMDKTFKKLNELGKKPRPPKVKKERFIKLKKILETKKERLSFVKELIIYSVSYGIPINYMLWGIFGIKFGIFTFPAFGFLFYLIKEELPEIRLKIFPPKR